MSETCAINCLVLGDPEDNIFTVQIRAAENISTLKGVIKIEQGGLFKDVDITKITLITAFKQYDEIKDLTGLLGPTLKPISNIGTTFQYLNSEEVHVIIGHPPPAGFTSSWTLSLQTMAEKLKERKLKEGIEFPVDEFISIDMNPIMKGSMLYIRKCYLHLYNIIKKIGPRPITCAITGVPGIGKSCFLIYFTLRLLFDSPANQIVIFEVDSDELYLFSGTKLKQRGSYRDFMDVLNQKDVWYVSDHSEGPSTRNARTVTTLSPRKTKNEFPKFHHFLKGVTSDLCMPVWTLSEISKCRTKIFPHLSTRSV